MSKLKKIGAGVGGVGILLLSIYLAAFLFVILLVVGGIFAIYVYFKSGPMRKEMAKRQAEFAERHGADPGRDPGHNSGTIDGEYVVVEEQSLDAKPTDRQ